jgi:hypothetical protein
MAITNRKISQKREDKIAKDTGGRRHAMSGGMWHSKGDASNEYFLIEDKFTKETKYSLNYTLLNKIAVEARKVNKIPIFKFGYILPTSQRDYVLIRKEDCNDLVENVHDIFLTKDSTTFHENILNLLYLDSTTMYIAEVNFLRQDKIYYLLRYRDFVDNMDKFRDMNV